MPAFCWTCRSVVDLIIQVYNLTADEDTCPLCLQPPLHLCVAVQCGHHICAGCSQEWARRQASFVKVPGGPAAPGHATASAAPTGARAMPPPWHGFPVPPPPEDEPAVVAPSGAQVRPPPWLVAPPQVLPAAPAVAPLLPAVGGVFEFHGRPVLWVRHGRFGACIVLVYQDTGRLCQDGSHTDEPAAVPGWIVHWHEANTRDNRKWTLCAWLDV